MVFSKSPRRKRQTATIVTVLVLLIAGLHAQLPLRIEFQPGSINAHAVASPDSSVIVSVFTNSAEFVRTDWKRGGQSTALRPLGLDPITRLCFFAQPEQEPQKTLAWHDHFEGKAPVDLKAVTIAQHIPCRHENWVQEVNKKVLPLALMSVSFAGAIPPAGTPLIDAQGKIVGLILQPAAANRAYAIPAAAVHRVQNDIVRHGKINRGWIGLSLSTESQIPRITRIWPDSPDAKIGLRENDILSKVGTHPIERYADAVNAFFYLRPGQPSTLEILRGNKTQKLTLTPTSQNPTD